MTTAHLLKVHGETAFPVNNQLTFSIERYYYGYNLSAQQHAWHKPDWTDQSGQITI